MLTSLPAGWRAIQSLLPSTRFFFSACSLTLLFSVITWTAWAQNTLYVTPDGAGARNGSSWTNALSGTALQGALASAPSGTTVLVAAGLYKPTLTTDQSISFSIPSNVEIYGGYAAGTMSRTTNPSSTTLSGDIDTDNTLAGNTYKVVQTAGTGVVLDGLVISQGDARPLRSFINAGGGGLFANGASITLRQVQFINNAAKDGGGVFINRGSATLTNCFFSQNTVTGGGGGGLYFNEVTTGNLASSSFIGNTTNSVGGAMYNSGCSPSITNCSFNGNSAVSSGGVMYNYGNGGNASPTIINCSFSRNTARQGGVMDNRGVGNSASPTIINCSFSGNTASQGTVIHNEKNSEIDGSIAQPTLTNCILWGNQAPAIVNDDGTSTTYRYTDSQDGVQPGDGNRSVDPLFADAANGNLQLTACSPAINVGDNSVNTGSMDLAGNPRRYNGGIIDLGAYEYQSNPAQSIGITQQPVSSSSVCSGATVTASVSVSGTSSAYQWYKDGQIVTGVMSATTATLTLTNVQPTQSGTYVVVVTGCNSVTSTPFSLTVTPQSPDYQPLVDFYNSTGGPGWTQKDNWLTGCSPCGWFGVTCANGRVTEIRLGTNNLTGTIPASLSALSNLTTLQLNGNQLSGAIPTSIGSLTSLQEASLQDNRLSGNLPTSLGNLSSIQILNLGQNQLSGSVPASLSGLSNPSLQRAYFDNNQLSGCFPASLSALCGKVSFSGNANLPGGGDFGAFCANGAGSDAFNSSDYQALTDLYNSTNGASWTNKTGWLNGCSPCGWYGISCVNGRVTEIKLGTNNLNGTIPASLSALSNLTTLQLNGNQLSGAIPTGIGSLTNLQELSLQDNQLSGNLPATLSNLSNVRIVNLGQNQLRGSVPASLTALTNLNVAYFNNNQLSGCFPASLSALCGKLNFGGNPNLPGGGNFDAFCSSGAGSDAFRPLASASPNPVCVGSPVSLSVTAGTFYQWSGPASFMATTQTPGFTPSSTASSGVYSVTVGNGSPTCTATASVNLTVSPLPTPSIVGLASAYCQDAPAVTLAPLGSPAGGSFAIDGLGATTFNPAKLSVGQHSVVYSYTNSNGCSATASQMVTVKEVPQTPTITTQVGGPYPSGQSSLTISQNTGNVILTVSGCQGGSISWNGGNSTTLAVSTANLGTQSFTATCTSNGCTSPTATATVTVVVPTLKVLSRDPDNGQLNNNTIKPYLLLQNAGTTPIPYSTITLRYWLTTENNIPLIFQKNYVQIGQGNLNLRYVALNPARQGATGYIEYSFSGGVGSLAPNGDSGPLEVQASKQDYSRFVQSDDYSYINNSAFTLNPRITAYQNGVIFYGQEPTGTGSTREAVPEAGSLLQVKVLGNPVVGPSAEVEISGASGQTVQLKLTDLQGKMVHGQSIKEAASTDRVSLPLGNAQGILLLEVSTSTQRQQIKLLRP